MSAPRRRPGAECLGGLHVLADDAPHWKHDPVEQARGACRGGAHVVQLRAKGATDREALAWARAIRALTRRSGVAFFVNDRFDLALAAEADGVHLGQEDLPPGRVPPREHARLWIGRSTHTFEQARRARAEAVDYVAFGPVFGTRSKVSEYSARGTDALAQIVDLAAPLPVVAIGGIDASNVGEIAATGAAGAAVISAAAAAPNPTLATRELVRRMGGRT